MRRLLLLLVPLTAACAGAPAVAPAPGPDAAAHAEAPLAAWPPPRPIPEPVRPPRDFLAAVERGTRTGSGHPGPAYWQQWTDYSMSARIDPGARRLEGSVEIVYHNRSPVTLPVLVLELAQNYHAPGVVRLEPAEVTGGMELLRVAADGEALQEVATQGTGYLVDGTVMAVFPPRPLSPGGSIRLELDWAFDIPAAGAGGRMGHSEDNLLFLAYWYPRMAVFDDVVGWQTDPFLGAEFYHGFGSYRYAVEVPAEWVVHGTGTLRNPEEVLAPDVLARWRRAETSDSVISVLGPADFGRATRGNPGDWLTWRFDADTARDVAFSATRESHWDAVRTPVGDRTADGAVDHARIDALYRPTAPFWREAARYGQHSIDFLSRYTGLPYPWPHMTLVEGGGIIGGGMEFPMITLMGDYNQRGDSALYFVTAHELAHMWIPMIVSTDERRYSWIDEGFTTFAENQARHEFFPGPDHDEPDRQSYLQTARAGLEGEMMRRSDYHYPGPAFGVASYAKPATVLVALRSLLGEDIFERAYREIFARWAYRHPYPWDIWNVFEDVSGRNLGWFWHSWYRTTWVLDHAVADVAPMPDGTVLILIEDRGDVPMPARVRVTRADGSTLLREVPVETWLRGARQAAVYVPAGPAVVRVEVDPDGDFPDVDRENDVWVR